MGKCRRGENAGLENSLEKPGFKKKQKSKI